jgi:hypothetical protein
MRHKVTTELRYPGLWRGCVGAWNPGLGPTGLTLRDWSGFGNHGTLTNMALANAWAIGRRSYWLDFDGSDDRVEFNNSTTHDVFSGDCTVSFWAQMNSFAAANWDSPCIISKGRRTSTTFDGLTIQVFDFGGIQYCQCNLGTGATQNAVNAFPLTAGVLYHFTFVIRGGRRLAFLNGVQTDSVAHTGISVTSSSDPLIIGDASGTVNNFAGKLDDLRIYRRGLSQNEIRILANRRGIAYELAPRRRSSVAVAAGGFNAAWIPRRSLVIGGGTN